MLAALNFWRFIDYLIPLRLHLFRMEEMSFSTTQTNVIKSVTILKTAVDWDEWILAINLLANRYGIKEYVDLTKAEIREPTPPTTPEISEIKEGVTWLTDLDAT